MLNQKISESLTQLANIAPVSQGVGSVTSGWVSVKNYLSLMALINVGVFGASATVDANIQQATSAAGAGAKAITGKAITQMLAAGGNNKQCLINLKPQELDTNNNFAFVQLTITVGTAATLVSAELLGAPRFEPAEALNQAAVTQIL